MHSGDEKTKRGDLKTTKNRKLVRHHPELPAGAVCRGPAVTAVNQHLVRRGVLVARTEGAKAPHCPGFVRNQEIRGPFAPFLGDDDPAAKDRVFAQFGHGSAPLFLFPLFLPGFTIDAQLGHRAGLQPLPGNLPAAAFADAEGAITDPFERRINLGTQLAVTFAQAQLEAQVGFQAGPVVGIGNVAASTSFSSSRVNTATWEPARMGSEISPAL